MTRAAPAGWYPDPWLPGHRRWWTGTSWTGDVFADSPAAAAGATAGAPPKLDPLPVPPPPPDWRRAELPPHPESAPEKLPDHPVAPARTSSLGWAMLGIGLVLGFLAGFAVFRADDRGDTPTALGVPSATASPAPAPGTTPSPRATPSPRLSPPPNPFRQLEPYRPEEPLPGPPASALPLDPQASALDQLGLRQSDVGTGLTVSLIPGGDQVAGEQTLDLCDGQFRSEARRTARRQVAAFDARGTTDVSTEAVLYDAVAAVDSGFAELRAAARDCALPQAPDTSWPKTPGVERLAFTTVTPGLLGADERSVAVYLRRGRVLLAVYFVDAAAPPGGVAGKSTLPAIVDVFAKRLAALPANVVNR